MKTLISVMCGVGLLITFCYSILGLIPGWTMLIPLVIGKGVVR